VQEFVDNVKAEDAMIKSVEILTGSEKAPKAMGAD